MTTLRKSMRGRAILAFYGRCPTCNVLQKVVEEGDGIDTCRICHEKLPFKTAFMVS